MPKKRQILLKKVPEHENSSQPQMDSSKVETKGVANGTHPPEPVQESKSNDKMTGKSAAAPTQPPITAANPVSEPQSSATQPQPVVPPIVLTTKGTKNDKKAQNSSTTTVVNKKGQQNKEVARRVTRHSPQNVTNNSETKSSVSPTKTVTNATNGRTEGAAASTSNSTSPTKVNKQLPTKQVFAHKRSPSSPLPPNPFNTAQVRATKSKPTPPPTPQKDPTPTLKANFLAAQKSRSETNAVLKAVTKRTKRKAESKNTEKTDKTSVAAEDDEPRVSKRIRLQYQPFQSPKPLPAVPFMYRAATLTLPKKEEEEKLIIYQNNEFLAVRNETNGFYICRAKQNVIRNSRKFKIQWFNNDKNPMVYTADFYDTTDFECILTNLTLIRLESGRFQLPDDEKQRINNILQRAINVEKGNEKPDPIKMIADGVDISVVGKVDEKELLKKISPKRIKKESVKPKRPSSGSVPSAPSTSTAPKPTVRVSKRQNKAPLTPSTPSKTMSTRQSKTGAIRRSGRPPNRSTASSPAKSPTESPASSKASPKDKKLGIADVVRKLKMRARSADLNNKQLNTEANSDGDTFLHLFVNQAISEINIQGKKTSVAKFIRDIYESDETLKPIFCQMSTIHNKSGLKPIHLFLKRYSGHYSVESEELLLDFLRFLVETLESDINSATICQKPEDVEYVIHLAAKCKTKSFVELILSKKPNLEQLSGQKRTALTIAVINKNIDISKLLLESGADVKFVSENDSNLSILLLEAIHNRETFELIPILVSKGAAVNDFESEANNRALHYIASQAEQREALSAIKALVEAGADINAVNKNGRTPLHLAVNSRREGTDVCFDVEDYLLRNGAKTDIRDIRGRIPLHYAFVKIGRHNDHSIMDPIELVALLDPSDSSAIGQQPSADVTDNFGSTPLHYAAQRGATISCMHLLKAVNINPVDNNDNTPLGLAVLYKHEYCALMLQQKGASFVKPVGNLNRKPELRMTSDDKLSWKWNRLKEEEKLKRELDAKASNCSIIEEVVRNNWQGLLYLMINELTTMGRGVTVAIESALKANRLNLAIKLLKRVKSNKHLNPYDQTLLHVMAKERYDVEQSAELQRQIVSLLVGHEVQLSALDSQFKSNAIIYAAINWNHVLCNDLTERMTVDSLVALEADNLLRRPVTAVFWDLHNKENDTDIPQPMKVWLNRLLEKNHQQLNVLSHYPIAESIYAGVRYTTVNPTLQSIANSPKYSPLIFAIICGNYSVVKYLLNLKISGSFVVDINLTDSLGRTPLMHSVRLNDLKMVKLLLNRSYSPEDDVRAWDSRNLTLENKNGIDMTAKDSNGWTVVHHLVSPNENFTYLHADVILRLLWNVTNNSKLEVQLFDVPNAKNETPLEIAVSRRAKNLVKTLNELLDKKGEEFSDLSSSLPHFPKIETNFISEEFDYKSDSLKMIEQIDSQTMEVEDNEKPFKPDELIAIDNADVAIDTTLDLPFDVLLTKVDIDNGIYGSYSFYKMQIIEQKNKDKVLLFTRWGRIGEVGKYQKTPFATLDKAIKEFKKTFKSKTGNNWNAVKEFKAVPKKYRLVDQQRRVRRKQRQYKVDIGTAIKTVESKLPTPLFELIKSLVGFHTAEDALRSYSSDKSFTPFSLLKTETLLKAESILTDIEKLIKDKESITQKDSNDYSKVTHEIIDLSEEFYHLVPLFGYQYEKLSPLFTPEELRDKQELIFNLLHFEYAFELLLAAQLRSQDVNPIDYIYRCLGSHLQLLDKNEEESQLILQYIHNTANNPVVKAIYRVNRTGEEDRFKANNVGNNWLLWHGTKVTNVISILAKGLLKAPLSAQRSGHLFGKGICLADMFAKSRKYCSGFGSEFNGQKFMFLCEASLGNVEDVRLNQSNADVLNSSGLPVSGDKHSLKTSHSQYRPDIQNSVYWKGRSVPLGPSVKNQISDNDYNEYVVFRSEQICLRYLIQFSD